MTFLLEIWQNLALNTSPVAFSIGSFELRYYSLMYLVAFAVVYFLVKYRLNKEADSFKGLKIADVEDLFLWLVLAVVVGGRVGYILFYDFGNFLANPVQAFVPFNLSSGEFTGIMGMSFHGGLIAAMIAAVVFVKVKKIKFEKMAKLFMPAIPLGYMFGRIGNFLNDELWGAPTESAWGMFRVEAEELVLRHPSQLYEAFFEGFVLFVLLWIFRNSQLVKNNSLELFLFGYGFFRFLIEYIRVPDAHLGYLALGFTMGQWLCIGMMALALGIYFAKKAKN
jgi:phosphatidylglycerol:prolipoprotein diacylglycerol transferase